MFRWAVIVGLLTVVLGACSGTDTVEVKNARIPMPTGSNAAVYFELTNATDHEVEIVGAESSVATAVIHETVMNGDVMGMQPLSELTLEPGETVDFAPGGLHVMLMNVPALEIGQTVQVTLMLRDSDPVVFDATVGEIETP
jgi:periplasmic copper chaperone A